MTLKDLRCYRVICSEIAALEDKLNRDKYHVVDSVQSAADFPYWKHSVAVEGDLYPYPVEPELRKIRNLKARKADIERYVAAVPDIKIRRCMELYFIYPCVERVTWEMVADALGDGSTGNAIKIKVSRYVRARHV